LHSLKPLGYVRYGDDFVLWLPDELSAHQAQIVGVQFLKDELRLSVNHKHDHVQPAHKKLAYLGVELWPYSSRLNKRVYHRTTDKLTIQNAASYHAITKQYLPVRYHKRFTQNLLDIMN
jgi:hypothetical protein